MRIGLVSREFAPYFGAGIGTYASQMAAAWAAAGHEVHVVTGAHPGLEGAARPGARFHRVDLGSGAAALDAYRFDFLRHAMGVYEALKGLHGAAPLDYIEFPEYWGEGYFAIRAKRTLGVFAGAVLGVRLHTPTHECRGLNREDWLDEEIAYLEHAEEATIREADIVISPTRSLLGMVSERLRLPATLARAVVPYPFDPASVSELGGVRPGVSAGPGAPTILYFGRLEHRKGVHVLMDAAQTLMERGVDVRVRLIGGDTATGPHGRSYREWVQRRVRAPFRDRFSFEGARPRGALGEAIRAASVCCFPSLWENFPNACLEAMALGAPVVASDAGGMGEIVVDGESGLLFRSGDAADLARALGAALSDSRVRARVAERAPGRVAELCEPRRIVAAMEEAIRPRPGAGAAKPGPAWGGETPVSVVIPFYNLGAFLPRTLESLRAQTWRRFETIVVDDGSTDADARALLEDVGAGRFGPVRVVRQGNGGLSAARNAGIQAARGRWIVPLDADDVLEPGFLEACLGAASRDGGLTFVTSLVRFFTESPGEPFGGWVPLGVERDILAFTNCASTCTALIDREAVVAAGGYDPWLTSYEDWDLWCRLAGAGARGAVIPEFLIHYRCRPDSMVRTEGRASRERIHAFLLARHASLPSRPDRTMRLIQARGVADSAVEMRAEQLIAENMRYRVVDRMNRAMKVAGIHRAAKGVAAWLGGDGGRDAR